MVSLLRIWGVFSLVFAVLVLASGRGAIREIEAGVALVIMTLSFGLSAIINAVHHGVTELRSALDRDTGEGEVGEPCPHCGRTLDDEVAKLPSTVDDDEVDRAIASEGKWKW